MSPVKSWSYSAWALYDQCPLKYKLAKIDKLKEPASPAMERGIAIGKMMENYLKGKKDLLDEKSEAHRRDFKEAVIRFEGITDQAKKFHKKRSMLTIIEDNWAFTKEWAQTTWDNWKDCWLRVKLDYAYSVDGEVLHIIDWKTGKFRDAEKDKYVKQLELYCLSGLLLYPHIKTVTAKLCYLDLGREYPNGVDEPEMRFSRADIPALKKTWVKRIAPMFVDEQFAPKPNGLCGWCHFRASNGGPCKF